MWDNVWFICYRVLRFINICNDLRWPSRVPTRVWQSQTGCWAWWLWQLILGLLEYAHMFSTSVGGNNNNLVWIITNAVFHPENYKKFLTLNNRKTRADSKVGAGANNTNFLLLIADLFMIWKMRTRITSGLSMMTNHKMITLEDGRWCRLLTNWLQPPNW